jgi:glycosyltransferase involved in cell wall biosynthesis
LFVGGYTSPAFNALAREVRAAGGRVVLMSDNNWTGTLRQRTLDPLRHWLLLRRNYDGILVPGASGERIAASWGYGDDVIERGLYGADPALFTAGPPLVERRKAFLFVGQFIARKNVLGLADAFVRFAADHPDWSLSLCGNGAQKDEIPSHPQISVHGFVQPPQLSTLLRNVRCLVLPSLEEHWGLVVHEAALSGCALALSRTVGAAADLARPENALLFEPGDSAAIARALAQFAGWSDEQWAAAELSSRQLASAFGPNAFADGVERLAGQLGARSLS